MSVRLPFVPSLANYRFSSALAGTQYIFDVRWNERDSAWYLDLKAEDETPIRSGIKIVLGCLLGGRVVDERFPLGVFMAADLTNRGEDAGFDDLGDRVVVDFYAFTEFEEA